MSPSIYREYLRLVCYGTLFENRLNSALGILLIVYHPADVLLASEDTYHHAGDDGYDSPLQEQATQGHRKKAHEYEYTYPYPQDYSLIAVHSSYP